MWLVAARSGSKTIPDKNIKKLAGIPLLAYRIKTALKIASKDDVWISTDSPKYAEIAEHYGASVPFLRPEHLASDKASSNDVVLHAINFAEKNNLKYNAVCLLEPTSPFIESNQLSEAVNTLFKNTRSENIVSVREVRPSSLFVQEDSKYLIRLSENIKLYSSLRRQDFKREITPSGGFYIAKWDAFKKNKTFYTKRTLSFFVPDINGLEIDEIIDWEWAEYLIKRKIINLKN